MRLVSLSVMLLLQERQPQDRLGDVGARHHSYHARYLLTRAPHDARERGQSDGGRSFLARANLPGADDATMSAPCSSPEETIQTTQVEE
jgi:hypothetical protein